MAGMTPEELLGTTGWSTLSGQASSLPSAVVTPQPSLMEAIFNPWISAGQQLYEGLPRIAGAVSQGIQDILITKYLKPVAKSQGTTTNIYYEKPQAGTAPGTTVNVVPSTGGMGTFAQIPQALSKLSPELLLIGGLGLVAILLFARRK
jgi:hypothetical protein